MTVNARTGLAWNRDAHGRWLGGPQGTLGRAGQPGAWGFDRASLAYEDLA